MGRLDAMWMRTAPSLVVMLALSSPCLAAVETDEQAIALTKQCLLRHGGAQMPELKDHWYARKMLFGWRVWNGIWANGNWEMSKGLHLSFDDLKGPPDPDWCAPKADFEDAQTKPRH